MVFRLIERFEGVFHKIKKFRVWLRLFQAFLQEFNHEQCDRMSNYVCKNILVQKTPVVFLQPLQVF